MRRGLVTINAPCAQGVVGFLREAGGTYVLADVEVKSGNTFVSGRARGTWSKRPPYGKEKIEQIGTQAMPTGWQTRPVKVKGREATEITNTGTMPWRIRNTDVELKLANPGLTKASVLNAYGQVAGPLGDREGGERMSREAAGRGDVRPSDSLGVPCAGGPAVQEVSLLETVGRNPGWRRKEIRSMFRKTFVATLAAPGHDRDLPRLSLPGRAHAEMFDDRRRSGEGSHDGHPAIFPREFVARLQGERQGQTLKVNSCQIDVAHAH